MGLVLVVVVAIKTTVSSTDRTVDFIRFHLFLLLVLIFCADIVMVMIATKLDIIYKFHRLRQIKVVLF